MNLNMNVTLWELMALPVVALAATLFGTRMLSWPNVQRAARWAASVALPHWLLTGGIVVFCLLMGSFSILRHVAFESSALDLGMMDQLVWNSAHGRWLQGTFIVGTPSNFLGHHFSPLLAALAPLYWAAPFPQTLLGVQVVAVAATSGLLYAAAVRLTGDMWLALALACVVLLHPLIHDAVLYDFHQDALGMACLALGLLGISYERWGWAGVGWLLSLLVKEEMTVYWIAIGLFVVVADPRYRLQALLFALLNGLILLLLTLIVIPGFHDLTDSSYRFYSRYASWGGSFGEIRRFVMTEPLQVIRHLLLSSRLHGLFLMLLPVAIFLLGSRLYPLLLLLPLAINSLADLELQHRYLLHYSMLPIVIVLYAATQSVVAIQRRAKYACQVLRFGTVFLLLSLTLLFWRESQVGQRYPDTLRAFTPDAHDQIAAHVVKRVPSEAVVIAQNKLVPHLSQREWITLFGRDLAVPPDMYVLDVEGAIYPLQPEAYVANVKRLLNDPEYGVVHLEASFIILQRGANREQNEAAMTLLESAWPLAAQE